METFTKLAHLKRAVDQAVNQILVPGSYSGVGQPQLSHPWRPVETALVLKHFLPPQEFLKHVSGD